MKKNKEKVLKTCKNWRDKNQDKIKKSQRKYYDKNKEIVKIRSKKWVKENFNKRRIIARNYKRSIKDRICLKIKERMKNDINFRIKITIRKRILSALKSQNTYKNNKSVFYLGCSVDFFKQYLESKFQQGMSWENHGRGDDKWHIDHIIPCSAFDLTKKEEQLKCFNYKNCQPLWQKDNLVKNSFYNGEYY